MRGIANSNSTDEIVVPDLDVAANHANVDVDLVVATEIGETILDVIDHDDHCSCLFQLYFVDVDVVGIVICLSN